MSLNVLIVDDSATMRKILRRNLDQAGLEAPTILEAGDGAEALSKILAQPVDLVFCDINMPNMNGIDFLAKLGELDKVKSIPVVMITTEGCDNVIQQAQALGARAFVKKPFTPEQAKETICRILLK
jgi:two-component system chemotaxis response regulator CheY